MGMSRGYWPDIVMTRMMQQEVGLRHPTPNCAGLIGASHSKRDEIRWNGAASPPSLLNASSSSSSSSLPQSSLHADVKYHLHRTFNLISKNGPSSRLHLILRARPAPIHLLREGSSDTVREGCVRHQQWRSDASPVRDTARG